MNTKILLIALSLSLTGCLGQFADKAAETDAAAAESLEQMGVALNATADAMNATGASVNANASTAAPVARITAFAAGGALIYKSNFQAEDPKDVVVVPEKSSVQLIAADSEAIAPGAKLTAYAWTLDGKSIGTEKSATAAVEGPAKYLVVLTVTDSNGRTDTQTLTLGVAPKPFDVVKEFMSDVVVGAEHEGKGAALTFKLALADAEVPATVQAIKFVASPPVTCDIGLAVTDPAGESMGNVDQAGNGGEETISAGAVPEGDYAIALIPITPCAAPEGMPVTVTVTFLPTIEGLEVGDGHGGHAGH